MEKAQLAFSTDGVTARVWTEQRNFTISQELEQRQVDGPFPARILLQSDAVAGGGEHFPAANGHQLAALVFASHVIQHGGVVDEGVQFAGGTERQGLFLSSFSRRSQRAYPVFRLLRASSTPFWLYLTMCECISG